MSRHEIVSLAPDEVSPSMLVSGVLSRIRRFWALPGDDQCLFLLIALLVPVIEIGLRIAGYRRVTEILNRIAPRHRVTENQEFEVERHRRLLFQFHLQFPFAGRCLARALTLWSLLNRRGISTELRFGIKKDGEELAAHAWVEFRNQPLTLDRDVTRLYTVPDWPIGPGVKISPIKI